MRIYATPGFTQFVLAAGHRKEMLYDYFNGRFPEWKIRIVDTGDDADTADRVIRCAPYVGERFFATYGDGLGDVDLHALFDCHVQAGALATLTTVPLRSQYGLVLFDGSGRVTRFEEQPLVKDYWINAGFFVLDRGLFDVWNGHNLESDVLPDIARRNELNTYRHHGFWKSMDTSKDQQELERIYMSGHAAWLEVGRKPESMLA
jgi:glucose-1-phosphate cytidylyltransferase